MFKLLFTKTVFDKYKKGGHWRSIDPVSTFKDNNEIISLTLNYKDELMDYINDNILDINEYFIDNIIIENDKCSTYIVFEVRMLYPENKRYIILDNEGRLNYYDTDTFLCAHKIKDRLLAEDQNKLLDIMPKYRQYRLNFNYLSLKLLHEKNIILYNLERWLHKHVPDTDSILIKNITKRNNTEFKFIIDVKDKPIHYKLIVDLMFGVVKIESDKENTSDEPPFLVNITSFNKDKCIIREGIRLLLYNFNLENLYNTDNPINDAINRLLKPEDKNEETPKLKEIEERDFIKELLNLLDNSDDLNIAYEFILNGLDIKIYNTGKLNSLYHDTENNCINISVNRTGYTDPLLFSIKQDIVSGIVLDNSNRESTLDLAKKLTKYLYDNNPMKYINKIKYKQSFDNLYAWITDVEGVYTNKRDNFREVVRHIVCFNLKQFWNTDKIFNHVGIYAGEENDIIIQISMISSESRIIFQLTKEDITYKISDELKDIIDSEEDLVNLCDKFIEYLHTIVIS